MIAKMSLNQKKRLNLKSDYDIRLISLSLKGHKISFPYFGKCSKNMHTQDSIVPQHKFIFKFKTLQFQLLRCLLVTDDR